MDLQVAQNVIVREMFVRTADENYIVARWCLFKQLDADFCWLAVHALEKYLKAVLLLNGHSSVKAKEDSKEYRHDIVALYEKVESAVAPEFLSQMAFDKPANRMHFWRKEDPRTFLQRLYRAGRADNRYQVFGYERHAEDLVKLDMMVFAIRRLCRRLDVAVLKEQPELTRRKLLQEDDSAWELQMNGRLEQVIRGGEPSLRDAVCCLNFPFAPSDYEQPDGFVGMTMRRSALYTEILRPLRRTPEDYDVLRSLVAWVQANIKLPPDALKELREEVDARS